MPQYHQLRTDEQLANFLEIVKSRRARGIPVTVCFQVPESTERRSLDQNALWQIWSREFACHLLNKKVVTEAEHEDMKYTLQRRCYADTGWSYLLTERHDLFSGAVKPDRAHTRLFDKGQMYQFMEWVQHAAADRGLILESHGEYLELKQQAMGSSRHG